MKIHPDPESRRARLLVALTSLPPLLILLILATNYDWSVAEFGLLPVLAVAILCGSAGLGIVRYHMWSVEQKRWDVWWENRRR